MPWLLFLSLLFADWLSRDIWRPLSLLHLLHPISIRWADVFTFSFFFLIPPSPRYMRALARIRSCRWFLVELFLDLFFLPYDDYYLSTDFTFLSSVSLLSPFSPLVEAVHLMLPSSHFPSRTFFLSHWNYPNEAASFMWSPGLLPSNRNTFFFFFSLLHPPQTGQQIPFLP